MTRTLLTILTVIGWSAAHAGTNPPARSFALDFSSAQWVDGRVVVEQPEPWLRAIDQAAGTFEGSPRAWVADDRLAYGQGRLNLKLNRAALPADLALTLVYEETPGADFVVQLADDEDRILALDLFSNIVTAGREARTGTFIISFADHPNATQIVLRRLRGEVRVYGLVLTPVACEVPVPVCDDGELAIQLGRRLEADNELVQAAGQIAQDREVDWASREVITPVPVTESNDFARAVITKPQYPDFAPSPKPVSGQILFATTGSALFFVSDCARRLNLYHPTALAEVPSSLTSTDAKTFLMDGGSPLCIMSEPMSVADRERFFRAHGYHVLEVPVAIDAIQVVVNSNNPIEQLTIPQLDAIYGTERLAGAPRLARTWGDVGLGGPWADARIVVWGGSRSTSTSRLFQKQVLQGGEYRGDILNDLRLFYVGVIEAVATNAWAIGYSNLQHFDPGAKRIALAPHTGEPAYRPTPESVYGAKYPLTRFLYLYVNAAGPAQIDPMVREFLSLVFSREGQTCVARAGQIPLGVEQVLKNRQALGL